MANNVDAITNLVEGLGITNKTSEVDRHIPGHLSSALQDSIQLLDQSAKIIASEAQHAHSLAGASNLLDDPHTTEIYSLHRIANEFTEVTRILNDTVNTIRNAVELSIITYLTSLGTVGGARICSGTLLQRMLAHFDNEIRNIVREVLSNSGHDNCVPWKIAEECYNQSTSNSGALHPDNYFLERDEACPERPYDPDFEAEEYYEHENRLTIGDGYARAWEERFERRRKERKREQQSWVDFWVLVLNRCPGGPTLFYPLASYEVKPSGLKNTDIPQYLFRTFDTKSSGINNDNVVASIASMERSPGDSKFDILSLPPRRATEMIHTHLTKKCCGGEKSDDLMSWTSSLLFAIQYAIWRRKTFDCHSADIKICAVDTRRFPHGQFAPDIWLLQAYHNIAAEVGGDTHNFFHFRLNSPKYYNGEYLSQGSVNHAGRSCVVSFESLENSGLYKLYPEFDDPGHMNEWTSRVGVLRQGWSIEQRTTAEEIQLASMVAEKCFSNFETIDMVLILLAFKARKIRVIKGDPIDDNDYPEWVCRPNEVRRFTNTAGLLNSRKQSMDGAGAYPDLLENSFDIQMIKEIFDCT